MNDAAALLCCFQHTDYNISEGHTLLIYFSIIFSDEHLSIIPSFFFLILSVSCPLLSPGISVWFISLRLLNHLTFLSFLTIRCLRLLSVWLTRSCLLICCICSVSIIHLSRLVGFNNPSCSFCLSVHLTCHDFMYPSFLSTVEPLTLSFPCPLVHLSPFCPCFSIFLSMSLSVCGTICFIICSSSTCSWIDFSVFSQLLLEKITKENNNVLSGYHVTAHSLINIWHK